MIPPSSLISSGTNGRYSTNIATGKKSKSKALNIKINIMATILPKIKPHQPMNAHTNKASTRAFHISLNGYTITFMYLPMFYNFHKRYLYSILKPLEISISYYNPFYFIFYLLSILFHIQLCIHVHNQIQDH